MGRESEVWEGRLKHGKGRVRQGGEAWEGRVRYGKGRVRYGKGG